MADYKGKAMLKTNRQTNGGGTNKQLIKIIS